jgi:hypothetical protein
MAARDLCTIWLNNDYALAAVFYSLSGGRINYYVDLIYYKSRRKFVSSTARRRFGDGIGSAPIGGSTWQTTVSSLQLCADQSAPTEQAGSESARGLFRPEIAVWG